MSNTYRGSLLINFIKLLGITNFIRMWPLLTWIIDSIECWDLYLPHLFCWYLSVKMTAFDGISFATIFIETIVTCSPLHLTRASQAPGIKVTCLLPIVVASTLFRTAFIVSPVRVITWSPCIKGCHANKIVIAHNYSDSSVILTQPKLLNYGCTTIVAHP